MKDVFGLLHEDGRRRRYAGAKERTLKDDDDQLLVSVAGAPAVAHLSVSADRARRDGEG